MKPQVAMALYKEICYHFVTRCAVSRLMLIFVQIQSAEILTRQIVVRKVKIQIVAKPAKPVIMKKNCGTRSMMSGSGTERKKLWIPRYRFSEDLAWRKWRKASMEVMHKSSSVDRFDP